MYSFHCLGIHMLIIKIQPLCNGIIRLGCAGFSQKCLAYASFEFQWRRTVWSSHRMFEYRGPSKVTARCNGGSGACAKNIIAQKPWRTFPITNSFPKIKAQELWFHPVTAAVPLWVQMDTQGSARPIPRAVQIRQIRRRLKLIIKISRIPATSTSTRAHNHRRLSYTGNNWLLNVTIVKDTQPRPYYHQLIQSSFKNHSCKFYTYSQRTKVTQKS